MEDPIYRQFRSIGRYITERKMTDSEILQVFADVEAGMTDKATGANRTWMGRGKDTTMDFAGGVKDAYNSILNSIQSSAPVAAVDVAYNEATDALAKLTGGEKGKVMQAIIAYRNLVKEYPKTAGFAKAALVAIAGLATGGAGLPIIAGLTYALDSAIKGDKLSSVLGKGVGAAALSYAGQAAYGAYGDQAGAGVGDGTAMGDTTPPDTGVPPTDAVPSRFDDIVSNSVDYKVKPGDTLSDILADRKINPEAFRRLPGNEVFFGPDGNPNILKAGQAIKLPDPSDIPDLNRMSYTTPDPANYARFDKEYDTTGYTGQYNPNNSPYSLDATTNLKQQGLGRLGPDGGIAADRVAQDAGANMSSAGTNNFRADNLARMQDQADAAYYADKPDDYGWVNNKFNATNLTPDFDPKNVPAGMTIKQGASPVRESIWTKVAESVKFKTLPVDRLIDDRITILSWALNESIGRKSKSINLTTVGVYTVFENIDRYRKAILGERLPSTVVGPGREQLPDYGRPDAPGAPAPVTPAAKKGWVGKGLDWVNQKAKAVGGALGTFGHQFTTNVTKEKLKMNWQLKGRPSESDQLSAWLVTQGVPQQVITTVYNKMGIPHTAPAAAAPAATTTTATAPTATTTVPNFGRQNTGYASINQSTAASSAPAAPAANPFGQMANTLGTYAPPTTTSTGGTLTQTPTGQVHQAKTNNPNAVVANPATATATPVKQRTGGRVKGQPPSETPNAIRKRKARMSKNASADNVKIGKTAPVPKQKWRGPKPTGAQAAEYQQGIHNVAESLSWSQNFNPGMTLFRQMKREQS
jgi:hypothetical protein